MSILNRIAVEIEGMKFGYIEGQRLAILNPGMSPLEVAKHVSLEWVKHLHKTGRQQYIKAHLRQVIADLCKADELLSEKVSPMSVKNVFKIVNPEDLC